MTTQAKPADELPKCAACHEPMEEHDELWTVVLRGEIPRNVCTHRHCKHIPLDPNIYYTDRAPTAQPVTA